MGCNSKNLTTSQEKTLCVNGTVTKVLVVVDEGNKEIKKIYDLENGGEVDALQYDPCDFDRPCRIIDLTAEVTIVSANNIIGDTTTGEFIVSNLGNALTDEPSELRITKPENGTIVLNTNLNFVENDNIIVVTIPSGLGQQTIPYTFTAETEGQSEIDVEIINYEDTDTSNNENSVEVNVDELLLPDVTVGLRVENIQINEGDSISIVVNVSNIGNVATSENTLERLSKPEYGTFTLNTVIPFIENSTEFVFTLPPGLDVGLLNREIIEIVYENNAGVGTEEIIVTVENSEEINLNNNSDSENVIINEVVLPDLSLNVTSDKNSVTNSETLSIFYEISEVNNVDTDGSVVVAGQGHTVIVPVFPVGFNFDGWDNSLSGNANWTFNPNVGLNGVFVRTNPLMANESDIVEIRGNFNFNAPVVVNFTGTIVSGSGGEINGANNGSSVEVSYNN